MAAGTRDWSKTVFRLRGLPCASLTRDNVCTLLSESLGDTPVGCIEVFSLASALTTRGPPIEKVATLMFKSMPSLIKTNPTQTQWGLQSKPPQTYLILDTHFLGFTPLNDPEHSGHVYDCIAISGLSSHPFGSWQPKTEDKTFMWIRDILPGRLPDARALIYGYDTKLGDSTSLQLIEDLAGALITHLDTYGWNKLSAKRIIFLAHSLGGLVLKEALISLSSNREYKILLENVKGAVLFGVPNHGMEQSHFKAVVGNNANRSLVEDLSRTSHYILQHQFLFQESRISDTVRFFWAYETMKSPTTREGRNGQITRDGPLALLVSPNSATCGNSAGSESFPINATHSDMVKFTRGSECIDIVIRKIEVIMESKSDHKTDLEAEDGDQHVPMSTGQQFPSSTSKRFEASIESFRRATSITDSEYAEFSSTDFNQLENYLRQMQEEQERSGNLLNMNRLEPFLAAVKQYTAATRDASPSSELGCYIWGPMKYVLSIASTLTEAYHSVLDAYNEMGDSIPLLSHLAQRFISKPFLCDVLIVILEDILEFHRTMISIFKRRCWKQIFTASWPVAKKKLDYIKQNMQQNRRSLEYSETFTDFENSQGHRVSAASFAEKATEQENKLQKMILQWLSVYLCDEEHFRHRETRKICHDAGQWLLKHKDFKNWLDPEFCPFPLLWLTGKPGAGKTILASIVIDEAWSIKDSTVVFFYCKYGDDRRDSLFSVLRSLLAQLIPKIPHLLPYFSRKVLESGEGFLSKPSIAKELLQVALDSLGKTYIIVDGLDECGKHQAKEITSWFQGLMENLRLEDRDSVRCLFVSQDQANTTSIVPTISVTEHLNKGDLSKVATVWHRQLENKFGPLRTPTTHIQNILLTRARGMFIFAELMFKYLEDQPNKASLIQELHPERLPVKLTEVYSRIMQRIFDSEIKTATSGCIRQVLGWIVCAKRPLYWREIQGAICIDVDKQIVDYERQLAESPQGLFAALVEVDPNGLVQLVHDTARVYLKEEHVLVNDTNLSFSLLTLNYLAFPQFDHALDDSSLIENIRNGVYAFYDYASVFWAAHLQSSMPLPESKDQLDEFQDTLKYFLEARWSSSSKLPKVKPKLEHSLDSIQATDLRLKVSQAILSHRKQASVYRKPLTGDEALNIWRFTERSRALFERVVVQELSEPGECGLSRFYGSNWFKCPRMDCFFYYHGFQTQEERESHILKHERPFFCSVTGCYMNFAGCASKDELNVHLLDWHGIDKSDEEEYPEAPQQNRAATTTDPSRDPTRFFCDQCPKSYTRKSALKKHIMVKHDGELPFACDICGQRFGVKTTLDRHRLVHDQENSRERFFCEGELEDGSKWGCGNSFSRESGLAEHLKKRAGRDCIRPYILQMQQHNPELAGDSNPNIFANQSGINAETLLAVGERLPSFQEFLHICGLEHVRVTNLNLNDSDGGDEHMSEPSS